jgi:hypothetical protein
VCSAAQAESGVKSGRQVLPDCASMYLTCGQRPLRTLGVDKIGALDEHDGSRDDLVAEVLLWTGAAGAS